MEQDAERDDEQDETPEAMPGMLYIAAAMVIWLCCFYAVRVHAQSTSTLAAASAMNAAEITQLRLVTEDNSRRITQLESIKDVGVRVAVLESDMSEIKWLSRTVAGAFIVQLIYLGIYRRPPNGRNGPPGPLSIAPKIELS